MQCAALVVGPNFSSANSATASTTLAPPPNAPAGAGVAGRRHLRSLRAKL